MHIYLSKVPAVLLNGIVPLVMNAQESARLTSLLSTNGKSMSNPILDANGNVDADASRRVEIKFRLKDEEMLEELQTLVEDGQKQAAQAVG